jgi:spermidine synthase
MDVSERLQRPAYQKLMLSNKLRQGQPLAYTLAMPTRPEPPCPDPANAAAPPLVRTVDGRRTLEFTPGDVQSEMLLARPDALVLAYARAMMAFALFVPRPRHIVMIGLGGGSLAKFCYRHFPQARITVIELRGDVIALREQFRVPPDDHRLRVLHADAAGHLARLAGSADVLLVDGFDHAGLPAALGSAAFYADCHAALRPGGVAVANIFSYDPARDAMLARLRQAFGGRVCWFDGMAGNNHIFFALRPGHGPAARRAARWCALAGAGRGLGARWLNWLLARLLVAWLGRGPLAP